MSGIARHIPVFVCSRGGETACSPGRQAPRFTPAITTQRGNRGQLRLLIALPQRGQRVLPPAQVVPQLEHWDVRAGRTGFTGPQA